jgi:hypothetical protein
MALEGSLRDFGLADILQLIFFQRKTGVLVLESRIDRIRLLFNEGNIIGAESRKRIEANRLGKVLVKRGVLDERELQSVLDEQRRTNIKLGTILIKRGLAEKEAVEDIITGQIKETVVQIFNWKQGTYEFTPQEVPVEKDLPIFIDTQHLLMDGLRVVDEWSLIEDKFTIDTVFSKTDSGIEGLPEEEEEILSLVDGQNDVSTIIDITAKDDFVVSKSLASLMEKGVIVKKETAPVVADKAYKKVKKQTLLPYYLFAVVVILITGVISLYPLSSSSKDLLKGFIASEMLNDLRFQIEEYNYKQGTYPEKLDMISKKLDPWGRSFVYNKNDFTFIVFSAGADGIEGTRDDIY